MSTQRQPKGIPVGGQFAPSAHDEASSSLVGPGGTMDFGETRSAPTWDHLDDVSLDEVDPYDARSRVDYLIRHDHISGDVKRTADESPTVQTYEYTLDGPSGVPVGVTVSRGQFAASPTPSVNTAILSLTEGAIRAETGEYDAGDDSKYLDFSAADRLRTLVGERRYSAYISGKSFLDRTRSEGEFPPVAPEALRKEGIGEVFWDDDKTPAGVWSFHGDVVGIPTTYYVDDDARIIGRSETHKGRTSHYRGDGLKGGEYVGTIDSVFGNQGEAQ